MAFATFFKIINNIFNESKTTEDPPKNVQLQQAHLNQIHSNSPYLKDLYICVYAKLQGGQT